MAAVDQKRYENNSSLNDLRELSTIQLIDERLSMVSLITKRYYAEYISLTRLIELQVQSFYSIQSDHQRKKILHGQKIISDADYETSYYNYRSEEENLIQVLAQNKAKWELDLAQRRNDSIVLQA